MADRQKATHRESRGLSHRFPGPNIKWPSPSREDLEFPARREAWRHLSAQNIYPRGRGSRPNPFKGRPVGMNHFPRADSLD